MASNAETTLSTGLQHPHADSPAQDLVASTTPAANNAPLNVPSPSVSSVGDTTGREMKKAGVTNPIMKPSPLRQAPPWATSLLGGRASMVPLAMPASAQVQRNSTTDADIPNYPPGTDIPDSSRSRSPRPPRTVSDIVQSEPGDPLAIKLKASASEETPELDMAGKKKTLAGHSKIQALQDSWISGRAVPAATAITDSSTRVESAGPVKNWLGGGPEQVDPASASRKRSLPGNPTGNETKRRMTAVPLPDVPPKTISKEISTSGPVPTELDLLNAISAARPGQLKPTVTRSTEVQSGLPSGVKPETIPVMATAQTAISSNRLSDEDNQSNPDEDTTDDDEMNEEPKDNVPKPQPAYSLAPIEISSSQESTEFSVTKDAEPRSYLQWLTPQGLESAYGTILPTNYQLHSDPDYPFICAVRNCRKMFPKLNALGRHFRVKHRSSKFNDNLDGTLSFVDYYKKAGLKYSPPIVVSQSPLRGDEPPMPEPATAGYKPVSTHSTLPNPTPRQAPKTRADRLSTPRAVTIPPPPVPLSSDQSQAFYSIPHSRPTRSVVDSMDLLTYLRSQVSPAYKIPIKRPDIKALLKLPRQRPLPPKWRQKFSGVGHLAALATVALLVYLTGDEAPEACSACQRNTSPSDNVFRSCVVMAAAAPPFLKETGSEACAGCQWQTNFRREPNNCSLLSTNLRTSMSPAADAASPAAATHPASSSKAIVDAYPLPYPPPPASKPSQPSQPAWPVQETQAPTRTHSSHLFPASRSAPTADSVNDTTPGRALRRVTRHSLAVSKEVAKSSSSNSAPPTATTLTDNAIPSNMLEMEAWEIAPGRLRDERSQSPTNVAFSNSYLTTNQAVTVSEDISFNVIVVKPGGSHQWPADTDKVRVCSLATGKLRVKLDNTEPFQMGPNGMFKLKPGVACTVENRLYIDAVVHITTVSQF